MNHKRLLNALAKVGATVTNEPHGKSMTRFRATKGSEVLVWYAQKKWDKPEELEAVSVHAPHPDTDAMTDLFMDTFLRRRGGSAGLRSFGRRLAALSVKTAIDRRFPPLILYPVNQGNHHDSRPHLH